MKYLLLLMLATITLNAEQSFYNTSATITEKIYYGVEQNVKVQELGIPTDFYLSIGNGQDWFKVSENLRWGDDLSNSRTVTWTPSNTFSTPVSLGIHTGNRNSGTYSTIPTDLSDNTFTVDLASLTFNPIDNIWFDDVFYIDWEWEAENFPNQLIFQYNNSNTWETIDTLSTEESAIYLHNTFIEDDTEFRFTYIGDAYGYTIGSVSTTFLQSQFAISNRNDIESVVWGDNQELVIEYEKLYYSQYTYIIAQIDGITIDSIGANEMSTTFITPNDYDGNTMIEYYDERGNLLTTLNVESMNKFFELSPITDDTFEKNSIVEFEWSYSSNFKLVSVQLNGSYVNVEWDLNKKYSYSVNEQDTLLNFSFTVDDKTTSINRQINNISINPKCDYSEYLDIIDSLEIEIATKENERDTIVLSIVKDVINNIENEYYYDYKSITTLSVLNRSRVKIPNFAMRLYVYNYEGQLAITLNSTEEINVENLPNGVYFVAVIDKTNNTLIYKFNKTE